MPEGVQDTFRYRVELDAQGLSAQLASVRDVVAGGLSQAADAGAGAVGTGVGAVNRISSDLLSGTQLLTSAASQLSFNMQPPSTAFTSLANLPGMPETFTQEILGAAGVNRGVPGVFPSQVEAVSRQRLRERLQMGMVGFGAGTVSFAGTMIGGSLGGAAGGAIAGSAFGPIGTLAGGVLGAIGGGAIADAVMEPFIANINQRMGDRARLQEVFGWNHFSSDERAVISNTMRQTFEKSLFSPETFNNMLPAARVAGFFRGVERGDEQAAAAAFNTAHQEFLESQFILGVSGPEGVVLRAEIGRELGRQGMAAGDVNQFLTQSRMVAGMRPGTMSPLEVAERAITAGRMGAAAGIAPERTRQQFLLRAGTINQAMQTGTLTGRDLALLGGTPLAAAERLTAATLRSQQTNIQSVFAMAFGDVEGGEISINEQAVQKFIEGGGSAEELTQLVSQKMATGMEGMDKIAAILADPGAVNAQLLPHQQQLQKAFTEDMMAKSGMQGMDGFRQLFFQRQFGVDAAERRALEATIPMERETRKRIEKDAAKFDQEVTSAIQTQQGGVLREFRTLFREMQNAIGEPIDNLTQEISRALVPPLESMNNHLENLNKRAELQMRSQSPINSGSVDFSGSDGKWMIPGNPNDTQGFQSMKAHQMWPAPMISMKVKPPDFQDITRLESPNETMAG